MTMIRTAIATALLAGTLVLSLASKASEAESDGYRDRVERAWGDLKDFTVEQKDAAASSGKELLSAIDARIEELSEKTRTASDEARVAMEDEIEELKRARARLASSLGEAGEATADGWAAFKKAVGDAVGKVRDTFADESE